MYVTLVDNNGNYLYETVHQLRSLLEGYIKGYQKLINPDFSIADIDSKFLQHGGDLESVAYIFVFTLELIKKYTEQLPTLPNNDFYKIKNLHNIFNLCLVVDKILEHKYKRRLKAYSGSSKMYISEGVLLLFEDKGWIPALTLTQKQNIKQLIGTVNPVLPSDIAGFVQGLILSPVAMTMTLNNPRGTPANVNPEMRNMLLAYKLRNEAAHSIKKETVLVSKYKQIIEHLMYSIFISIDAL